jgi:hypothetical protein
MKHYDGTGGGPGRASVADCLVSTGQRISLIGEVQRTGGFFSRLAHDVRILLRQDRAAAHGRGEDPNDNLYIAGASFCMPTRAVGPTMTIITNALRAADRERLE